jgi:structural maintenance of chromosome 2
MMATVIKDKAKIEETITELDRYKRDALKTTWTKVNGFVSASQLLAAFPVLSPPSFPIRAAS